MKKKKFWAAMCGVSLLNGLCFFGASSAAMRRGIAGVENPSALMLIPLLWVVAAAVLLLLNLCTLLWGFKVDRDRPVPVLKLFRLSGLSGRARGARIAFFLAAGLLMLFGYWLFAAETLWALAYAASGGALLLLLCAWKNAPLRGAGI